MLRLSEKPSIIKRMLSNDFSYKYKLKLFTMNNEHNKKVDKSIHYEKLAYRKVNKQQGN